MASLQQFPSGNFHITFDFGGKRFKRSLKTKDKREAVSRRARLEETLRLVELGRIEIPDSVDIPTFLLSDGKTNQKAVIREASLGDLFVRFFDSLPEGSLEPGSIAMMQIHRRHLERYFGKRLQLKLLKFADLQGYVSKRSQDPGIRGRKLSPSTIKKEINTLRAVWKWALASDLIPKSTFPSQGLRYPKTDELPPFQTFEQILKQTRSLEPESTEFKDLWSTVFLNKAEIEELLNHVQKTSRHQFLYPMFVFAAHTGARRSEIMRSRPEDFGNGFVTIRERKRKKRKKSTRQVPVSKRLKEAMDAWFEIRPESEFSICHAFGSSCTSQPGEPLTSSEAMGHFQTAIGDSRFKHLRGWHTFRHSFCSNCAAQGIDQRVIDEWVGHTTEEMRRRYRHLFPNTQRQALESVFG